MTTDSSVPRRAVTTALEIAHRHADGGRVLDILASLGRGVRSGAVAPWVDFLDPGSRERRDAARLADPNPWSYFAGELLGRPAAILTPLAIALDVVRRRGNPEQAGGQPLRSRGGRVIDMRGGGRVPRFADGGEAEAALLMAQPSFIDRLIQIESGGNPRAVTGSYRGLGQFGRDLERRYGITDDNWTDPDVQRRALGQHVDWLRSGLTRSLGRPPTEGEIYLAHQQGIAGAPALLSAGADTPAWRAIRRFYGSDARAQQAITGNIPRGHALYGRPVEEISAADFARLWTRRFDTPGTSAPPSQSAPPPPPGGPLQAGSPPSSPAPNVSAPVASGSGAGIGIGQTSPGITSSGHSPFASIFGEPTAAPQSGVTASEPAWDEVTPLLERQQQGLSDLTAQLLRPPAHGRASATAGVSSPFGMGGPRLFEDGGSVTGDAAIMEQIGPTRHLIAANEAMRLTPQEIALYQRHLMNLYGPGGFNQPNGQRSSLLASTFDIDGRTYVMPTVAGGRALQPGTLEYRAFIASQGGLSTFPSYATREEADARYRLLHDFMERDTRDYQARLGFRDGGRVDAIEAALRIAARKTDTNPSEAAKKSGRYAKGTFSWNGLKIAIENPRGSTRSGVDKGGKRWSVRMPATYGFVRGTSGADGDAVDVYVGRDHASPKVFVIDQVDAGTGKFDEHKCCLSYPTKEAALADYVKAFSDSKGKDRVGAVTEMSVDAFKAWLASRAKTSKPAAQSRKSYATGGSVMPLPSGKKNVGRNISELMSTGRSRDQAIAIALDVARRRGAGSGSKRAGKAYGGRVDMRGGGRVRRYADGGEADILAQLERDSQFRPPDALAGPPPPLVAPPPPGSRTISVDDLDRMSSLYSAPGYRPTSGIALGPQSVQEERDLAEEQRQANLLMEVGGIAPLRRAGLAAAEGRPLEALGHGATALIPYRPMAGIGALGAAYGTAIGADLLGGLGGFGPRSAEAQAPESDPRLADIRRLDAQIEAENAKIQSIIKKNRYAEDSAIAALTDGPRRRIATLDAERSAIRDAMNAEAANARALDAQKKQSEQAQRQAEYDRQVRAAEVARDAWLARDRRFSETHTGRLWDATGGLAPLGIAGLLGLVTRAGARALGKDINPLSVPMVAEGAVSGALADFLPTAYDAFYTEVENPRRRALEAYVEGLPLNHPRRQEGVERLRDLTTLPLLNPLRATAQTDFYNPTAALGRVLHGGAEGAIGGPLGGYISALLGRAGRGIASMWGPRPPRGPTGGGGQTPEPPTPTGPTPPSPPPPPPPPPPPLDFRRRTPNPDPASGGHWVPPTAPTPAPGSGPAWASPNAQQIWVSGTGQNVVYSTTDSLGRIRWWRRQRDGSAESITAPPPGGPRGYRRVADAGTGTGSLVG